MLELIRETDHIETVDQLLAALAGLPRDTSTHDQMGNPLLLQVYISDVPGMEGQQLAQIS